jgi:hypothetical protein
LGCRPSGVRVSAQVIGRIFSRATVSRELMIDGVERHRQPSCAAMARRAQVCQCC